MDLHGRLQSVLVEKTHSSDYRASPVLEAAAPEVDDDEIHFDSFPLPGGVSGCNRKCYSLLINLDKGSILKSAKMTLVNFHNENVEDSFLLKDGDSVGMITLDISEDGSSAIVKNWGFSTNSLKANGIGLYKHITKESPACVRICLQLLLISGEMFQTYTPPFWIFTKLPKSSEAIIGIKDVIEFVMNQEQDAKHYQLDVGPISKKRIRLGSKYSYSTRHVDITDYCRSKLQILLSDS
eukprot:TRINITY_DN299_c0_g1_i7.p1 TRINITY_DN299_c0_g1~~TRINITY_DN299_c0_g1_i7.p1  ORF type:complete len:238 (+),score=48.20 TRINITY_DN299_c0_g1_i7:422-1135(+)